MMVNPAKEKSIDLASIDGYIWGKMLERIF